MNMKVTRTLILSALLACALAAFGERPETPPPGMGKYVIVLWSPGTPVPGDPEKRIPDVPEPDVEKHGGRMLGRAANRRIVYLPFAAAKQLQRHQAVAYIQRIWTGESLDGWDERAQFSTEGKLATDADTDLEWGPKAYSYDGSGNIEKIGVDEYTYDSAGRLIKAKVNGKTETYQYDAFGNLTEKKVDGANPVPIAVDSGSNRVVGPEYDAAGNVTTRDGRARYTFDSLNMLSHYEGASDRRILYDSDDERIGTIIDSLSRWTIRDLDGQIMREYRGDDQGMTMLWFWEQDHIRGEGQLLGGETQEWGYNASTSSMRFGGERHYHLDHLGSVRMVTNKLGRSVSEHDFYPFGTSQTKTYQEPMNWGDPHLDGMRFAGHWRDYLGYLDVEGNDYLDYMHARYYDPGLGRFLSIDPGKDWDLQAPQSWNRYAYVRNNPVVQTDPSGEAVMLVLGKFGFRWGNDDNDDGIDDELQARWFSIVFGENEKSEHEAIVLVAPDGTPLKVWENAAFDEGARENVDWKDSFIATKHPTYAPMWAKELGTDYDPSRHKYDRRLDPLFKDNVYQCTNYCEWKQSGQPPLRLLMSKKEWVRAIYGKPHLEDRDPGRGLLRNVFTTMGYNWGYKPASQIMKWKPRR